MASKDDEDELERTMTSETDALVDPTGEISAVIDELETLLKNGDVVAALTARNINASLALLAIDGVRAYLSGKKGEAADDFATVAEEIARGSPWRLARGKEKVRPDVLPPWSPAPALSGARYSSAELSAADDRVFLLDQRRLPTEERYVELTGASEVVDAIRTMVVRGAPAIGIAAAYGMVLAARAAVREDAARYTVAVARAGDELSAARPTAVNLAWAVAKARALAEAHAAEPGAERWRAMAELARRIHTDDVAACKAMGRTGAARLPDGAVVLTHCNAGALATGGYGTALGVIRAARDAGKRIRVIADETRPWLQGARLTAWELAQDDIPVEVIADSMAGHFLKSGEITAVVVGADRIARNGDVANKIGTYGLACLARAHAIPFYVAAPWSTVDLATPDGDAIPIEERTRDDLARIGEVAIVPAGVPVRHPAFDVTPARLVTAIFTERGEHDPAQIEKGC